jgi:hypothetical protein
MIKRSRMTKRLVVLLLLTSAALAQQQGPKAVLWSDPGDIRARNLFWGPGGEKHKPELPVTFVKDDTHGSSPKFDVEDADGKKWSLEMGLEPRPETVASRLMWAVGYGANFDYYFADLHVDKLPARLRRGQEFVRPGGQVVKVRLQRHPEHMKRVGDWNWRHNPFYGTREFNGLRVMMALIANWDLKDDNNAILEDEKNSGPEFYEVSDVGTAMGTPGKSYNDAMSKGNLLVYQRTKLVRRVHHDHIDLNFPKCPPWTELIEFEWGFYLRQVRMRWIGKHIPRADAKWIGSLLAQLSPEQIRDALRASGYNEQEIESYTKALLSRIQELNSL